MGMEIGNSVELPRIYVSWPHQVQLGDRVVLEPDIAFKFDGIWCPGPSIIIEDEVFLGRGCEFNIRRGIIIGARSAIGSGCRFIDHDHGITGVAIDETRGDEREIVLGQNVWLGCNVVLLKGVEIGDGAVVAAGSVVTKRIPAGEIWAGVPARRISSRAERAKRAGISMV